MALMERVTTLLRANLNDLVDKAEDPEKMLKQLVLDMENQLLQVNSVVDPRDGKQQNVSRAGSHGVEHLIEHGLQQDQPERFEKTHRGQQRYSRKQLQQKWAHVAQ